MAMLALTPRRNPLLLLRQLPERLAKVWRRQRLTRQFVLASAAVFVSGMTIVGFWTSGRIESGVTHNTAAATALYFESFVAPAVQDLAKSETLPLQQRYLLDQLITDTPIAQRVVSFKLWRPGGVIVYATNHALIGQSFPMGAKQRLAWSGQIAAALEDLEEEENRFEKAGGVPLLEIYVPIREENSGRIIAVAEFYERADQLLLDIFHAKLESWLIISAIAVAAMFTLFGIVGRASRTIDRQNLELQNQVAELQNLLAQNQDLRARIERSSQRAQQVNEQQLRRLGAELHDGPAQLLGLALLRLDSIERAAAQRGNSDAATIRTAVRDALAEIRNISVGLSLPALDQLSLGEALQAAVRDHMRRTHTQVEANIAAEAIQAGHATKTAAYRLVQEALNNAQRHAAGASKHVEAYQQNGGVVIQVRDTGKGFDAATPSKSEKLGLAGMRERIESLGGEFAIQSIIGGGTTVTAKLPLEQASTAAHV